MFFFMFCSSWNDDALGPGSCHSLFLRRLFVVNHDSGLAVKALMLSAIVVKWEIKKWLFYCFLQGRAAI